MSKEDTLAELEKSLFNKQEILDRQEKWLKAREVELERKQDIFEARRDAFDGKALNRYAILRHNSENGDKLYWIQTSERVAEEMLKAIDEDVRKFWSVVGRLDGDAIVDLTNIEKKKLPWMGEV